MQLSLKAVLAAGTLLGAAIGFSTLTEAAPAGLTQSAPGIQSIEQPAMGAPKAENVWWHRRWHRW